VLARREGGDNQLPNNTTETVRFLAFSGDHSGELDSLG
jgi:hypothetical protein